MNEQPITSFNAATGKHETYPSMSAFLAAVLDQKMARGKALAERFGIDWDALSNERKDYWADRAKDA